MEIKDVAKVQEGIDSKIKEIKVTPLDISFNEIADMYVDGELIIKPDYQRTFRWDIQKQSRFIESLLLEMPIPPIYVIEIESGKYELIDGLQRISTYLCFRDLYKNESTTETENTVNIPVDDESDGDTYDDQDDTSKTKNGFSLIGCDIVPELNGLTYEDLPSALKIKAKRSFIRMEVLRKGINPELKYHMFKRLNTGGEKLSAQEIRNCSIRMVDSRFIDFIISLSTYDNFCETISRVSQPQLSKKFAEELVLRFYALKNGFDKFSHKIDTFLTEYMEEVAKCDALGTPFFDYDTEASIFKATFDILNKAMGKECFSVYKNNSPKLSGFNIYHYEAITYAVQKNLVSIDNNEISVNELKEAIIAAKKDDNLRKATVGGGKNSSGVLKQRCRIVEEYIEKYKKRSNGNVN